VIESIEWLSDADRGLIFEGNARRIFGSTLDGDL